MTINDGQLNYLLHSLEANIPSDEFIEIAVKELEFVPSELRIPLVHFEQLLGKLRLYNVTTEAKNVLQVVVETIVEELLVTCDTVCQGKPISRDVILGVLQIRGTECFIDEKYRFERYSYMCMRRAQLQTSGRK